MSYFPTDMPFMSDEEKRANGIESNLTDTNVGNIEYIRREDAIRLAEQGQVQGFPWQFQMLVRLPPADVVQVVHGRWIDADSHLGYFANCSACGYQMDVHAERGYFNFCPNCGAKMQEES